MSDLLQKISSYNIFNYLLPGTLFVILADAITHYSFAQQDIIIAAFLYYFIGLVISRLGSLIVEPLLRKSGFVKFTHYPDFVHASAKDLKLEVLSEANNTYRTFCAMLLALAGLKLYEVIDFHYLWLQGKGVYLIVAGLFVLFLFSYRKQTNYITKRVEAHK